MASARSRLTAAYAGALLGTVVLFAGALWIARRAWVPSALERPGRQAEEALAILRDAASRGQLVAPVPEPSPDTIAVVRDTAPRLTDDVIRQLSGVNDFVFVLRLGGQPLYMSQQIRNDQVGLDGFFLGLPPGALTRQRS